MVKCIYDLPHEVVVQILDFIVFSELPFYAQHPIDVARELKRLQKFDDTHPNERSGSPPSFPRITGARLGGHPQDPPSPPFTKAEYDQRRDLRRRAKLDENSSTADYTSMTSILNAAAPSQQAHLRDWIIINGTCRLFRTLGKQRFFTQKIQFFGLKSIFDYCAGRAAGISPENQALAVSCAKTAIIHVHPKASNFQRLPRIQRLLPKAQKFGIYSGGPLGEQPNGPALPKGEIFHLSKWDTLPTRLEECLRNIGLDIDLREVGFLYNEGTDGRIQQDKWLMVNAYPALEICASFIQRIRARAEALEAAGSKVAP